MGSGRATSASRDPILEHLAHSPLSVVEWDADFTLVRWQGAAERMFGWRADEVLGRRVDSLALVHPGDEPLVAQMMARLANGRERNVVSRHRNVTERGEVRHCEWNHTDVTPQVLSEEARTPSAARLDEILRAMPDGFFTFDRAWRVTAFNPAAEAHFGRPASTVLGKTLFEAFPELAGSELERHYRSIFAEGGSRRFEIESPITGRSVEVTAFALSDGVTVFFRDLFGTAVPLFGEGGRVRGVVASFIDVTERKLAVEGAMTRVGRLHQVASTLLSATTEEEVAEVLSGEGREAFGAMTGAVGVPRPEGELECLGIVGLTPELAAGYRRISIDDDLPIAVTFRTGAPLYLEQLGAPTPQLRSARLAVETGARAVIAVPLQVGGRTVGALGLGFPDHRRFSTEDREYLLTLASEGAAALERIRLFRDAETARDAAEAASRAKDELLAMLGHELRNPLAPMVTALGLLDLRAGSEGARERAILGRQIRHLSRLVDDLLDVSRITQGKITLDKKPLALQRLVADVIERLMPLIDERNHRVVVEAERAELMVDADEDRLAQVVTNLVTNAARYM
jgi:PAS domain S-box-containing protein